MTRNQLDTLLRGHVAGSSTAFFFKAPILRLLLAFALTALEVAGVPSLAAPTSFATATDMANFFRSLVAGNGYKLVLRRQLANLIAYLVLRYAQLQVQNVTPVAPTVGFDTGTRTLTASHQLGTGELEYQQNGGAWQAYAPVNVNSSAHGAGEWQFRVKAAAGRNASAPAGSPNIDAVVVNPPAPTTYARTLTVGGTNVGYGISLAGSAGDMLEFNDVASQGGNPLTMILNIGGNAVAQVDFDPVYNGQGFRYTHNGTAYTNTFQASNGLNL